MARSTITNVTADTNVHSGKGSVQYFIISHSESTTQTVTIYDSLVASGTVIASFKVAPEASPAQINYPDPYFLRFSTGLTVSPGNCTVIVQSVGN